MLGLGGGFILVPILRLFFGLSPAAVAGNALALIVANSASSSVSYLLQRRVDLRVGLLVGAGGVPGSILGAIAVRHTSPRVFDWLFAVLLFAAAVDIGLRQIGRSSEASVAQSRRRVHWIGIIALGFVVGLISSLFGVGGGVVLVPSLLYFTNLTAHAVSATSQFGILLTSPVGLAALAIQHEVSWHYAIPLVIGGLSGGPIGAALSPRVKSRGLLRLVAIALAMAAIALVARHFF